MTIATFQSGLKKPSYLNDLFDRKFSLLEEIGNINAVANTILKHHRIRNLEMQVKNLNKEINLTEVALNAMVKDSENGR